jgi:hypothetical protein
MKPFGTIAIVLLLVVTPSIAAQTVDQVPLDFRELFNTLRYPGLTTLEQQALIAASDIPVTCGFVQWSATKKAPFG